MALHFERTEFAARIVRAREAMAARRLDGLLMFQQESMYYLTGYDTFGFCFFQCLYLAADGTLALLTRSADLRQAQHTSIIEDIRIWTDAAGEPWRQGKEAWHRDQILRPDARQRQSRGRGHGRFRDARRID
jgi:Xaa-Pro aminopeptidase